MKHLKKILTAVTLVAAASSASAVQFNLAPAYFTPGSGYSVGGSGSFTKLGVDFFADTTLSETFVLASGSSATFKFGTVQLDDGELVSSYPFICGGSTIPCAGFDETDNLGVTATFSFTTPTPTSGTPSSVGTGFAVAGFINPKSFGLVREGVNVVDFSLTWADKLVDFGGGGQFKIVMDRLDFTFDGQTLDQTYHIEMVTAPIPEPETYALMLAGLGVVGFMARRRRKA